METVNIGVDIGGMTIKGGIVDKNGKIRIKKVIKTDSKDANIFFNSIYKLIEDLKVDAEKMNLRVKGVGFGVPGVVNTDSLSIDYAPNLNLEHFSLKGISALNVEVAVSNDANCATIAEQKFGSGKGFANVVLLTIGTGVGGGVIINNKLFQGVHGKGTELGHSIIKIGGRTCGCGRKGCLEAYCSARALVRYAKNEMRKDKNSIMWSLVDNKINNVNGIVIFDAAKKNDAAALKALDTFITYLGESVLNYCNIFRPDAIIIGGGISAQKEFLIDKLRKYVVDRNYGFKNTSSVEILAASLDNDAGIIGAANLIDYE